MPGLSKKLRKKVFAEQCDGMEANEWFVLEIPRRALSARRTANGTTRVAPGRAASLAAFRMPPVAPQAPRSAGGLIGRSFAVHQYKRGRRMRQLPPSAPPGNP